MMGVNHRPLTHILNPSVERTQRWFHIEALVAADIKPGEQPPSFSHELDGTSSSQLPWFKSECKMS